MLAGLVDILPAGPGQPVGAVKPVGGYRAVVAEAANVDGPSAATRQGTTMPVCCFSSLHYI